MANKVKYDVNKNYYQILSINENATTAEVMKAFSDKVDALRKQLNEKKITQQAYDYSYSALTEAAEVLSDASTRKAYDKDRAKNNTRTRVVETEEGTKQAKKGRGILAGIGVSLLVLWLLTTAVLSGHLIYDAIKRAQLEDDDKRPGYEFIIGDEDEEEEKDKEQTEVKDPKVKNFGDPTKEADINAVVDSVDAQLKDLGIVNLQTGNPYSKEEIKAIVQFVNGAYKPSKEADAYTIVDEYLNFMANIISSPKTLNMIQYQANSDVVTEDIVKADIRECKPFDFTTLLMGDSGCHEVISYFNGLYGQMLSTTNRTEYKAIHNELYQSLAQLMYGDGLVVNGKTYTMRELEGLGNLNDGLVFNSLMYNIMPFHVEGIDEEFTVHSSQAGDVVVPIGAMDEQFNALCDVNELRIDDNGLVVYKGASNFATITQINAINAALENYQLGNTDAYANGYQYKKTN